MKTKPFPKLFCVLAVLFAALFVQRSAAESYQIPVFSGFYIIADQLEMGGNTLNEVLTTNAPFGSRLYKWDTTNQNYVFSELSFPSRQWIPNRTLKPGEGGVFSPGFTNLPFVQFTGSRRAMAQPYSFVVGYQLVSHQFPDPATYEDTGLPEVEGAKVQQWTNQHSFALLLPNQPGWKTSTFTGGAWQPSEPSFVVGESFFLYLPTTNFVPRDARVKGFVKAMSPAGAAAGPLAGVTVDIAGQGTAITDAQGFYQITNVAPGDWTVTATKAAYLSRPRMITLAAGERKTLNMEMIAQSGSGLPTAYDFQSDNGRFFITGTPGALMFSVVVVWNGSPGSVVFSGSGGSLPAMLTDLGGGQALASVSLASIPIVTSCGELTVEVTNGSGAKRTVKLGAYFDKQPARVGQWFGNVVPWQLVAKKFQYDYSTNWIVVSNSVPSIGYSIEASVGIFAGLKLDPRAGTFNGKLGGLGKFKQKLTVDGVKNTGEATLSGQGTLIVRLPGCAAPEITPGWTVGLSGKAGLQAPVVIAVDKLFPPAVPFVAGARKVPGLKNVIDAAKLGVYVGVEGTVSGKYQNLQTGNCFLGTTSLETAVALSLELEAVIEGGGAKARIFGRGTVRPMFAVCPELEFLGTTLEGTVGLEASAWIFETKKSKTWTITLGGPQQFAPISFPKSGEDDDLEWQPIGNAYLIWGEANHLIPVPTNGTLVENVTAVAAPSLFADANETLLLFSRSDTNKPWHAAHDIGSVRQTGGGAFAAGLVTDDLAAEFSPRMTGDAATILAAWERVSGDLSGATNPLQVAAHLDIAAAFFDRANGTWSAPLPLTANGVVDREPLPVAFGATRGVVWIQNASDASIGDAASGDLLLYSQWTGVAWSAPQILWSAPKGILKVSFAADSSSQGHIVFAVDEDGNLDTRTDRELYRISTSAGVWQSAVRLTTDVVEDSFPALVAPNGIPMCVWSASNLLVYSALGIWNPQPLYAQAGLADEATSLAAVTLPGGAAVAYPAGTTEGSDVFAALYDASVNRWSQPRRLTHDEDVEDSLSLAFDGTQFVLSCLKNKTIRTNLTVETLTYEDIPQPGRRDISLLRFTLGKDLAVQPGSLLLNPPNPAPGSNATIRAVIENIGEQVVLGAQVRFYDGNPQNGGTPIGSAQSLPAVFIAGATQEVSVAWNVPAAQNSHTIYLVVDPALAVADRDRSNNTNSIRTVLPDLTIETSYNTDISQTSVALVARVVNNGVLPSTACAVSWRLGTIDGEEIGRTTLDTLKVGQADEVTFLWDAQGRHFAGDFTTVYAVADGTNSVEEIDETNNDDAQSVRVIPQWVPHLLSIEILPGGNRKLTFAASHYVASEMSVERADSLAVPVQWHPEPGANITVSPGVFEVEVPLRGGSAFYRMKVVP